jgi:hypothetical protein
MQSTNTCVLLGTVPGQLTFCFVVERCKERLPKRLWLPPPPPQSWQSFGICRHFRRCHFDFHSCLNRTDTKIKQDMKIKKKNFVLLFSFYWF